MKYFLIIITLCFCACVKTPTEQCITYAEATQEDCVPTYSRLQEKEWILDSVVMKGKNITQQILIPFGGKFNIKIDSEIFECNSVLLCSYVNVKDGNNNNYQLRFNIGKTDGKLFKGFWFGYSNDVENFQKNNLLLGFYQYQTSCFDIELLNEQKMKLKFKHYNQDSVFYNYFSIH
jgi:hypothetical protein